MRYLAFIFLLAAFASCVSNKQVQYLQKDDVNVKDDQINVDSILRSYEIELYDYKVQPQDVLWINVESLTEEGYDIFSFSGGAEVNAGAFNNNAGALYGELVDEKGEIDFPVIGKVVVEGLTLFEIQTKIKNIAANYVEEPVVKVRLLNFRFTVLGEVRREGNITTYNNRVSLLEAIGLAGGLSELGDRSNIKLIRQHGVQIDVQYINLLDEEFINSPYYYIHQNDIIIVPPLRQRPFRRYFAENLGLIISSLSLIILVLNL